MIVFLIFSIYTAGPDKLFAGGWWWHFFYIFHSHYRSRGTFCCGWWWRFLYFPFTLKVLTSFLLGGGMIAFLIFSIYTAGPDELSAGGNDGLSNISTAAHHTSNEIHDKY
jgi:hypothetical protein